MVGKRPRYLLDSEVGASLVAESADDISKQVGSEGKHDAGRSADDIAKQVGAEEDKVVIPADDIAKQIGSGDKHGAHVRSEGRWKRNLASGKGKWFCKRYRDQGSMHEEKRGMRDE